MAEFDLNAYLNSRGISVDPSAGAEKLKSLDLARQSKIADLQQFREAMRQASPRLLAEKEADQNSWVGKLGLNPDSVLGTAVNFGAVGLSGAARVAGDIVGLVPEAFATLNTLPLEEKHYEAYNRFKQGKHTAADAYLLGTGLTQAGQDKPNLGAQTPMELLDRAESAREVSRAVESTTDISGIVHQKDRRQLTQDLGGGFDSPWDTVKSGWADLKVGEDGDAARKIAGGLGDLVFNAGEAAAHNPKAAFQYMVENGPQLLMGLAGKGGKAALALSNVGYGAENYSKGIAEYQKQHDGQLPPEDERRYMAVMAATTALAETLGDHIGLSSITKATGLGKIAGIVAKEGEAAVEEISRKGLKEMLLGTAKATVSGTASEALTEGYQTYAEGEAGYKPASAKDIYEGAVIGGLSGGGLAGGGHAVAAVAEAAVTSAVKRVESDAAVATAATTGDITALITPDSPTYNPEAVIPAMQAFAAREDATREEFKQARAQGLTALNLMEEQSLQMEAQTPQGRRGLVKELAAVTQELAATDSADKATMEELTAERDQLTKRAELPVLEGKALVEHEAKYKALTEKLNLLTDVIGEFKAPPPRVQPATQAATSTPVPEAPAPTVEQDIAQASAKVDPKDTVAVEAAQASVTRVINLSMQAPESLAPEVALKLASDTTNTLTESQRAHLRVFSEAQVAANALKTGTKVNQEVLFGDTATNQVGIVMYQKRLATAVEAGHQVEAARQLRGITKFMDSHEEKATQVRKAFEMASAIPGNDPASRWNAPRPVSG